MGEMMSWVHAVGLPVGSEASAQGCACRQPCRKAQPEQLQPASTARIMCGWHSTVLLAIAGLARHNSRRRMTVFTGWLQRRKLHSWLPTHQKPHIACPARHLRCRQGHKGRIGPACVSLPSNKRRWSWGARAHAIHTHCGLHPLLPLGGMELVLLPVLPAPCDGNRVACLEGSPLAQLRAERRSRPCVGAGSAAVRCSAARLQLDLDAALPCAARRADVGAEQEEQLCWFAEVALVRGLVDCTPTGLLERPKGSQSEQQEHIDRW